MITIICGEPGRGKTALMTYFAVQKMVDEGFTLWWQSCREIDNLKKGGFSALVSLPQRHTVYADYLIKNRYMQAQSYYTSGFNIALPNPFFQTTFFAPFSQIFLDEAQKYYDSRMCRYLRECVYRFYQLHRHNHLDVYMTCQRLGNIDLNIRDIAERIIYVNNITTKTDALNRIIECKWNVVEFNSLKDAEAYIDNNNKSVACKSQTYTFNGNIFDYYNSYGNTPVFYDGNYNRTYDCMLETPYADTVESYMAYNCNHMYYAPVGFWKNEKRDSEILKQYKREVV